jgi:hypothetical protein
MANIKTTTIADPQIAADTASMDDNIRQMRGDNATQHELMERLILAVEEITNG